MKIQFYAIGKEHEPYVRSGTEDFTKRIARYYPVEWKIIAPPKNAAVLQETELKHKEAGSLFELLKKDDLIRKFLMDKKMNILKRHFIIQSILLLLRHRNTVA